MPLKYPTTITAELALAGCMGLPLGIVPMGRILWVDSTATNAIDAPLSGVGEITRPFATIGYAVGRCRADRGDVVVVKPDHYEDAAGGLDWNCAGVTIIGESRIGPSNPSGSPVLSGGRPLIELTDANEVKLSGAGMHVHNLDFMADAFSGTNGMLQLNAAGQIVTGCRLFPFAAADTCVTALDVRGTDCILIGNLATQLASTAAGTDLVRLRSAHRVVMLRNHLVAKSTNSVFEFSTAAPQDVLIVGNRIEQHNGSVTILDLTGATGVFKGNGIYHADNATSIDTLIGATGGLAMIGNYMMNANGEAGGPVPAAASA